MARNLGLTAAVLGALASGRWMTCGQLIDAVHESYRAGVAPILNQKTRAGFLLRRGEYHRYEYRLNPNPPPARKSHRSAPRLLVRPPQAPAPKPAAEVHVPATMPAQHVPPASLGLVCASTAPANPAQGRIEEVLADALDRHEAKSLDQVLAAVPNGWSRIDVISGLADGVLEGWIGPLTDNKPQTFLLRRKPPARRVDPLAVTSSAARFHRRIREIEASLSQLLDDQGRGMSSIARDALWSAHDHVRRALQHVAI